MTTNQEPRPILRVADLAVLIHSDVVRVPVPEWAGQVCLTVPSSFRRDRVEADVWRDGCQDLTNFKAKMVALCLCDETGEPLYPDPLEGAEQLGKQSSRVLRRLFREARKLCPIGDEDIETLEKN